MVDKIPDWKTLVIIALLGGNGVSTFGFALPQLDQLKASRITKSQNHDLLAVTQIQIKILKDLLLDSQIQLVECKRDIDE